MSDRAEQREAKEFAYAEQVVERLTPMSKDARAEFFAYLADNYCIGCGLDRAEESGCLSRIESNFIYGAVSPPSEICDSCCKIIAAALEPVAEGGQARREGFCDDCKRDYESWFAASVYWNAVVRSQGDEPMLCASCFILRARAVYPNSIWKVTQDGDDSEEIRWLNEKVGNLTQEILSVPAPPSRPGAAAVERAVEDDEDPVTGAWLKCVGFEPVCDEEGVPLDSWKRYRITFDKSKPDGWGDLVVDPPQAEVCGGMFGACISKGGGWMGPRKTRGDLRRICAALGIEIKQFAGTKE